MSKSLKTYLAGLEGVDLDTVFIAGEDKLLNIMEFRKGQSKYLDSLSQQDPERERISDQIYEILELK